MRELTPLNLDRILIQREEGRKSHARKAATNNKKRRKAASPHTQAQGRKFTRSRERGKGSYTQGARGREGGMHISHYKNDLWGTFQILF